MIAKIALLIFSLICFLGTIAGIFLILTATTPFGIIFWMLITAIDFCGSCYWVRLFLDGELY